MRKIPETVVFWLCLIVAGCKPAHTPERVENAATATAYGVAVNKCVDDAIATYQTTQDMDKASTEFEACEASADRKYGRKP